MNSGKVVLCCQVWCAAAVALMGCLKAWDCMLETRFREEHDRALNDEISALVPVDASVVELTSAQKQERMTKGLDFDTISYGGSIEQTQRTSKEFRDTLALLKLLGQAKVRASRCKTHLFANWTVPECLYPDSNRLDQHIEAVLGGAYGVPDDIERATLRKIKYRIDVHSEPFHSPVWFRGLLFALITSMYLSIGVACYHSKTKRA